MKVEVETALIAALVGSLAASVVAAVAALIGQHLEREHRRRELLFTKSIELAIERRKTVLEIAREEGRYTTLLPDTAVAADIYVWLDHIFRHGTLPPGKREELKGQIDEAEKLIDEELEAKRQQLQRRQQERL